MNRLTTLALLLPLLAGCGAQKGRSPEIAAVRTFIHENWDSTIQYSPRDTATLIGLPHPYTVPTAGAMFREMYYWDTFFTNEGLVRDGHAELAKNNTDNLLYMVRRFGKVYNGSRTYYEARSQQPYLSMMVDRVYRTTGDRDWLAEAYRTLEREYDFWMRERITPVGLNRYGSSASDALVNEFLVTAGERLGTDFLAQGRTPEELHKLGLDFVAEAESGWDFNPRFERRCTDFCPLDLNANLFLYELNFARFARELGRPEEEVQQWLDRARERRARIMRYCYDPERRQFYDYDYVNDRRSEVLSAAVSRSSTREPSRGSMPRRLSPHSTVSSMTAASPPARSVPTTTSTSGPTPTAGPPPASMRSRVWPATDSSVKRAVWPANGSRPWPQPSARRATCGRSTTSSTARPT